MVIADLTDAERATAIDLALDAWRHTGGPRLGPLVWSEEQERELLRGERRVALDAARGMPL